LTTQRLVTTDYYITIRISSRMDLKRMGNIFTLIQNIKLDKWILYDLKNLHPAYYEPYSTLWGVYYQSADRPDDNQLTKQTRQLAKNVLSGLPYPPGWFMPICVGINHSPLRNSSPVIKVAGCASVFRPFYKSPELHFYLETYNSGSIEHCKQVPPL